MRLENDHFIQLSRFFFYGRSRLRDKLTLNNVRQRSQNQPYFLYIYGHHPVQDIQCSHDAFGEESKASCSAYSNTARVMEYEDIGKRSDDDSLIRVYIHLSTYFVLAIKLALLEDIESPMPITRQIHDQAHKMLQCGKRSIAESCQNTRQRNSPLTVLKNKESMKSSLSDGYHLPFFRRVGFSTFASANRYPKRSQLSYPLFQHPK